MRDIQNKTDGTGDILSALAFNTNFITELQGLVESADFILDIEAGPDTDTAMLRKAITHYATAAIYFSDGGISNAYSLSRVGNIQPLSSYKDGTTVLFKAANTNSGASTINVDSIGIVDLVADDGSALIGGEIVSGKYILCRYNDSSGDFEIIFDLNALPTAMIFDSSLSADLTATGIYISATVDVNATGITAALFKAADFNYEEADASATTTAPCTAMALESGTGTKNVLLQGTIRNDAWAWVAGQIFLSETAGAFTQTAPTATGTVVQCVGYAISATTMYFNPSMDYGVNS